MIAETPITPYYAVIFTSILNQEVEGYAEMGVMMVQLAKKEEGFLGIESAREEVGITISYWKDVASIMRWKQNVDHIDAQIKGRSSWYKDFKVRVAKVERDYSM